MGRQHYHVFTVPKQTQNPKTYFYNIHYSTATVNNGHFIFSEMFYELCCNRTGSHCLPIQQIFSYSEMATNAYFFHQSFISFRFQAKVHRFSGNISK